MKRLVVQLTMVLTDDADDELSDARMEACGEITEDAIRNRLMGEGFLPDDVILDSYGFTTSVED